MKKDNSTFYGLIIIGLVFLVLGLTNAVNENIHSFLATIFGSVFLIIGICYLIKNNK